MHLVAAMLELEHPNAVQRVSSAVLGFCMLSFIDVSSLTHFYTPATTETILCGYFSSKLTMTVSTE